MKLPPLLVYSVLRLLAFLVPLAIMWVFFPILREYWWLAAIFAALIGTSVSVLFLRKPLSQASEDLYARRAARTEDRRRDAEAEDAEAEDVAAEDAGTEGASADADTRRD